MPGPTTRVEVVEFHHNSLDHYFMTASRTRFEHVQDQRLSLGWDAHGEWHAVRGAIPPLRNPSRGDHPISDLGATRCTGDRTLRHCYKDEKEVVRDRSSALLRRLVDETEGISGTEYGGCFKCPR